MTGADLHSLFHQMGAVVSSVEALQETIKLRQSQADQLLSFLRADVLTLDREHHELEAKLGRVIGVMQQDLEALRADARENARSVESLVLAVQALRLPLADIAALRSRVAGLVFSVGIIGSAALWLAEPVYRWFVDGQLGRR